MEAGNYFFDTNIWIRYLTEEENGNYAAVFTLFKKLQEQKITVYFSGIIALEIVYVTTRIYNWTTENALEFIQDILSLPAINLIDDTSTIRALKLIKMHKLKFADAMVLAQLPENTTLVTYDSDFIRISELRQAKPEDLV